MPRGYPTTFTIQLTPADRQTVLAWQRSPTISAAQARRGRMLLLRASGMPMATLVTTVGVSTRFIYRWIRRFLQDGLAGVVDDRPARDSCPTAPASPAWWLAGAVSGWAYGAVPTGATIR